MYLLQPSMVVIVFFLLIDIFSKIDITFTYKKSISQLPTYYSNGRSYILGFDKTSYKNRIIGS